MSGVRPSPWQAAVRRANRAAPTNKCGMRTLNCGFAMPGLWRALALRIRNPKSTIRNCRLRILFLAQREEIREEAIGAGDTSGELSKEAQPGVHVRALAHRRHE